MQVESNIHADKSDKFIDIDALSINDETFPIDIPTEDIESILSEDIDNIEALMNPDDASINDSNIVLDDPSINLPVDTQEVTTGKTKKRKRPQSEIDQELVSNFLENQTHENFNKIWERFYYGVKSYAYKFMRNVEMADEIACITFTRGWEYRSMYDKEKSNFSTWLYTICRNLCLAELYRIKKDNYVPQDISELYDSDKLSNNIVSVSDKTQYTVEKTGEIMANSPDDITQQIYNTSILEINNLGGNYTKILLMKLVDDMKIREISDELDMNESTVKNYLYKGKEMLNNIMKQKHKNLYDMYIDICTANEAEAV